jgi:transcriptional regulator GlxA family with amidase domain
VPRVPSELPVWPPLLAVRGPGARSARHAHHAMHVVVCAEGELRVRAGAARRWTRAAGVITAPDIAHEIDATGADVMLVFVDPESEVGAAIRSTITGAYRVLTAAERGAIDATRSPMEIMTADGVAWTAALVAALGAPALPAPRAIHPRVRKLLRALRAMPADADTSLDALAKTVGLSPGRLMHAFTDSIGIPLRPYLGWLRLQRAAAAVVSGAALSDAAHAAGFADAAHMTRTFRQMFGTPPSALAPRTR